MVALGRGGTMGELRFAIWCKTAVPWATKLCEVFCTKKCQVLFQILMLRGEPMPTADDVSVTASGLADKSCSWSRKRLRLKWGYTYLSGKDCA